jgi:hypothetical protein
MPEIIDAIQTTEIIATSNRYSRWIPYTQLKMANNTIDRKKLIIKVRRMAFSKVFFFEKTGATEKKARLIIK